jgi:pilus assembly protein CpaB
MTDVIVQGAPVLGIDQGADATETKPAVAKTATLEVDKLQAQKLALSIQLGQLSLALRNVADQSRDAAPTVVPRQLSSNPVYMPARMRSGPSSAAPVRAVVRAVPRAIAPAIAPLRPSGPSMTIVRGSAPSQYEVQRGS